MPVTQSYLDFIASELSVVGSIRIRRMFGAAGLYCDEHFFALADNDTLYFKVDDTSRARFQREGMGPFRPYGEDGAAMNGYYEVPADVIEDRGRLREWGLQAVGVATSSKRTKRDRNRR